MRKLSPSKKFNKKLLSFLKTHPGLEKNVVSVLNTLCKDIFNPKLKTHKLSGNLGVFYGASINYTYRIVFYFDEEYVYLVNIGDHEEVY